MTASQPNHASALHSSDLSAIAHRATAEGAKHGWTPERRARQAEAIKRWSPWQNSTGPKSPSGKARAAQNATKHGRRAGRYRLLNQAFAAQRECVRLALLARRLRVINPSNELMARLRSRFETYDHIFEVKLAQYLYYERLCKNLAFSPPLRQIVNANDNG